MAHVEVLRHEPWRLVRCARCELCYLPEIPREEAIETDFDWARSFATERRRRWFEHPLMRFWTLAMVSLKPSREQRALRYIRRFAPASGALSQSHTPRDTPSALHAKFDTQAAPQIIVDTERTPHAVVNMPPVPHATVATPRGAHSAPHHTRLLDVGCGDGRLAALALHGGYDVAGVELSPHMAAKAMRRLGRERVHVGRLHDAPYEPGSFDLIVTVSYLEHDPDPVGSLRRMRELLRPGGVCVHKTPNYASRLRGILGTRWSGYRWPEHVQYYTPQTLAAVLERAGFRVEASKAPSLGDNMWIVGRRD